MHVSHIIRKSMKQLGRKPPVCVTRVVSVAVRGFLFTPWNAPPGDPRPPSVSFPGSSLQARGGRVPLHVSPEMSHSPQTRTRLLPHSPVVASPLRQFAFASPPPAEEGTRPGETRRGGEGVWACTCVYVTAPSACTNAAPCGNFECAMKCVKCLAVTKPWGLPDTAAGHKEEGDYLIAASYSAQIKTKVTPTN